MFSSISIVKMSYNMQRSKL